MGEVMNAFLASSSVGDKSKPTSHNLSRQHSRLSQGIVHQTAHKQNEKQAMAH